MKLCYPEINNVFDTDSDKVNTVVIENQRLMFDFVTDLSNQLAGFDGSAVVSDKDKILNISKSLELLTEFVPFDINKKSLLTKAVSLVEKQAVTGEKYVTAMELISRFESFLNDIVFEMAGNISFGKLNIESMVKASGIEFVDDYDSLAEKIIDYFELVTEYIGKKLFVTVNLRSYISDGECELFLETVLSHGYNLIMVENTEHKRLLSESRIVIDCDLCEIL